MAQPPLWLNLQVVRFVSFFEGEACADRLSLVQVLGQRWSLAKAVGQSKNSFLGFGEHDFTPQKPGGGNNTFHSRASSASEDSWA